MKLQGGFLRQGCHVEIGQGRRFLAEALRATHVSRVVEGKTSRQNSGIIPFSLGPDQINMGRLFYRIAREHAFGWCAPRGRKTLDVDRSAADVDFF